MVLKYYYLALCVEIRNRFLIMKTGKSHSVIFVSFLGLCIRWSFTFLPPLP